LSLPAPDENSITKYQRRKPRKTYVDFVAKADLKNFKKQFSLLAIKVGNLVLQDFPSDN
jgi:hypothetical protein